MSCKTENAGETLTIPESVSEIGDRAFACNKTIRYADLRNVTRVGESAFRECTALQSVVMSNVTDIGEHAFEFCSSLRSVTFGDVKLIGSEAFHGCGMLDIPRIPGSLESIGQGAFSHTAICRADLHWMGAIPDRLFSGCTSLKYADISGAEKIGEESFMGCSELSYADLGSLKTIGRRAFYNCGSLETAALPESLSYIGDEALSVISKGFRVPAGIRYIGKNCFGPVNKRKSIRIAGSDLYKLRNYFSDDRSYPADGDEHFYLWESSIDVEIIDGESGKLTGFLPLFSDLYDSMRGPLVDAFRSDNSFDYQVLDTVLFQGMRWNQKGKDRLAVLRLKYPYELSDEARKRYSDHLDRHSKQIALRAIGGKDTETLAFLFDNGFIDYSCLRDLIDRALSLSSDECTAYLLERQSEAGGCSDPLFEEL